MPPIRLTRTRRMLLSGRKLGLDCRYPTFTETVGTLFICLGSQGSLAVGRETARTSGTGWAPDSTWGSIGGSGKDLAGIPLIVYAQARVERTRKIINYSECVGSVGTLNVHSLRLLGTLGPTGTLRVKYTGTLERFLLRERKSLLYLRVGTADSIGSLRKLWFPKGCFHCGSEHCRHRLCASCLECVRSKRGKFRNFTKNLLDTRSQARTACLLGWSRAH